MIKSFRYPRLGPGQMWEAVAARIRKKGGRILLGRVVEKVFHQGGQVTGLEVRGPERKEQYKVGQLISTMPLKDLVLSLRPFAPRPVRAAAENLRYRDFVVVALIIDKKDIFPDQWIYIQDPGFACVRVQNINNWSSALVPEKGKTVLGVEYVTDEREPLWQKTDRQLSQLAKKETALLGFCRLQEIVDSRVIREMKAYPLYDLGYRKWIELIRDYISRLANLTPIGRNGTHKYNNMDHSMLMALKAVENLFGARHDIWRVDMEKEYLEKKS